MLVPPVSKALQCTRNLRWSAKAYACVACQIPGTGPMKRHMAANIRIQPCYTEKVTKLVVMIVVYRTALVIYPAS